ncbi:MAG: cardiolipin synthase [Oscillospiraceae bacterium]|nr:cardiolipin synthase [Oscillospiraceae bacterium]
MKLKKTLSLIFTRIFVFGIALLLQLGWFFLSLFALGSYSEAATVVLWVLSMLVVIYIINGHSKLSYKLAWIVPILVFPLMGGVLFLISGGKNPKKRLRKAIEMQQKRSKPTLPNCTETLLSIENSHLQSQSRYLIRQDFPVYGDTETKYYSVGEDGLEDLLAALEGAKKFIFMEYFIIKTGKLWDSIVDVLERKAAEGVDVRLIYDDVGCLSVRFDKTLKKKGISAIAFNPFIPIYSTIMNNRDHRKILVVDGNLAFTGGINLADEYINEEERFGHWKDSFVRLRGAGVWSLTLMFLQMWNALKPTDKTFTKFRPTEAFTGDGFVQPYCDSPLDYEYLGENVYLNMINNACRYVYVMTPYLILDEEMNTALQLAAKRGVDVRILTPGIPDKKNVWHLTRAHYPDLLEAGVRVFEYTPGFLHSKNVVCDDEVAVVGTINMDYRSLCLHFENACLFIGGQVVTDVRNDCEQTFKVSKEITMKHIKKNRRSSGLLHNIYYAALRLFAPLL